MARGKNRSRPRGRGPKLMQDGPVYSAEPIRCNKVAHATEGDAGAEADRSGLHSYWCALCSAWHVTHNGRRTRRRR